MSDSELKHKVVVITGASSGIGKGAAVAFAEAGSFVVIAARHYEELEEMVNESALKGGNMMAVPTDVSHEAEVEVLAKAALDRFSRIDVWINDAGGSVTGRFEEVPLDEHRQVIETNLLGTIYGSYFAMKQFRDQQSGILINIASVLGKVPVPYLSSYVASKHGVVGLSAALRQELEVNKVKDIHVCTVLPTSMDTPFFEHSADYSGHEAVPIPPVYDPKQVIDVLLRLAVKPEDEVAVGGVGGAGAVLAHRIAPGIVESLMAKETHHEQMEKAPPATDTPGNLQEPVLASGEVRGGWKK